MTTFKKPIAGDPANLILSEPFQSALVEVVNAYSRGELTKKPQDLRKQHVVMVKNQTAVDIEPGQALAVEQAMPVAGIPTASNKLQVSYLHNPLVYGVAVAWHTNIAEYAIATQTIEAGLIGPAAFKPWGQVKADIGGAGAWLMHDPDNPEQFKLATGGIARVITYDTTTGQTVANFDEQQRLWRYILLADVENLEAPAHLLDLNGLPYATITLRFLRNDEKEGDTGQCLHTGNHFDAIEDEQPTPRFRFRLKTAFNDTGQAYAKVLDTWGTVRNPDGSIVALGDVLVVNDPRKCFAHAIGYDDLTTIHAAAEPFFPAGGSVGYAVETEQLKADPVDPDDPQYPRWEVEQCTQTIDKMIVQIQGGYPSTPGTTDKPTGVIDEGDITLKFIPSSTVLSRWPYVDYSPEWLPPTEPADPWTIETKNPNRFSAGTGWAIIERRVNNSRAEDAENVDTPYAMNPPGVIEWHIVEVENPIARCLCGTYESDEGWQFANTIFEGENPVDVQYFDDEGALTSAIKTATCLSVDCIADGEKGIAFWDPNSQNYQIISTNSALYGSATDIEAIAQKTDPGTDPLLAFSGCNLEFLKTTPIKVFGMTGDCEETTTTETIYPALNAIDVITGSYRSGDNICFTRSQVYVCSAIPITDECEYVCCDELLGCCHNYDGTYTHNITEAQCDINNPLPTPPISWTAGDCPEGDCCDSVSAATAVSNAYFEFTGLNMAVTTGTLKPGSSAFTSSGDCGATLTFQVTWTNITCGGGMGVSQDTLGTAILKKNGTCCYWDVTLTAPTAACTGPGGGTLGDGWPGDNLKFPLCPGEENLDCASAHPSGDCSAVCDDGGFNNFPSFEVANTGLCT